MDTKFRPVQFPHYFYIRWDGKLLELTTPAAGSFTTYTTIYVNELGLSKEWVDSHL